MRCIVAVDSETNGIGYLGNMPWRIPEDLDYFKNCTSGGIVIMGRRTWESIGYKALKCRKNIVISNTMKGDFVFTSLDNALESVKNSTREIWIIGGAKLYSEAFKHPRTTHIHKTKITQVMPKLSIKYDVFLEDIPSNFMKMTTKKVTGYKNLPTFLIEFEIYEKTTQEV